MIKGRSLAKGIGSFITLIFVFAVGLGYFGGCAVHAAEKPVAKKPAAKPKLTVVEKIVKAEKKLQQLRQQHKTEQALLLVVNKKVEREIATRAVTDLGDIEIALKRYNSTLQHSRVKWRKAPASENVIALRKYRELLEAEHDRRFRSLYDDNRHEYGRREELLSAKYRKKTEPLVRNIGKLNKSWGKKWYDMKQYCFGAGNDETEEKVATNK